jgi:hypothetical protein
MSNFGWNDRPSKATIRHRIGGDKPAIVYHVGGHLVTVPVTGDEEPEVTYVTERYGSDPRQDFPNMKVCDGELRLPIDDLVGAILSRIEPEELAVALWANDDVRARFIEALTNQWSGDNVSDADRRGVLAGIKEAVHSKALDKLASAMSSIEYAVCRDAHYWDEVQRINERLRNLDVRVCAYAGQDAEGRSVYEDRLLQFDAREHAVNKDGVFTRGELEVGGRAWSEAISHWREQVLKYFPISREAAE